MQSHEIDYKIIGQGVEFVEIELDPGETVIAEAGSMMYMDSGIHMDTILGDGSKKNSGLFGSIMGASKRMMTGESLFMTAFTNKTGAKRKVYFNAPYPGQIAPIDLTKNGNQIICQRDAFLCCAKGIEVGIEFQKRFGVGFFGGEGFIMQRLVGDGMAFIHAGGSMTVRNLEPGETIYVDTGSLVAFQARVDYNIGMVKGIKSWIFSGEGMFHAKLTGPGSVWLQSSPFSRIADRIVGTVMTQIPKNRG